MACTRSGSSRGRTRPMACSPSCGARWAPPLCACIAARSSSLRVTSSHAKWLARTSRRSSLACGSWGSRIRLDRARADRVGRGRRTRGRVGRRGRGRCHRVGGSGTAGARRRAPDPGIPVADGGRGHARRHRAVDGQPRAGRGGDGRVPRLRSDGRAGRRHHRTPPPAGTGVALGAGGRLRRRRAHGPRGDRCPPGRRPHPRQLPGWPDAGRWISCRR